MGKAWDTFKPEYLEEKARPHKKAGQGGANAVAGTYDLSYEAHIKYQEWCNSWAIECLRVLKPGGYLLASNSPRMYHRMAVAIEDAGFEIRDMVEWVYGSGFPKSRNIGKDMEKTEVGGIKNLKQIGNKQGIKVETGTQGFSYSKEYVAGKSMGGRQISGEIPVYEINNSWGSWGTALKPAHEPICLARKPIEGTVANNVLKYGTGGLNIDKSRVEATSEQDLKEIRSERPSKTSNANDYTLNHGKLEGLDRSDRQHITGRFPANLLHDGSDEVVREFPKTVSKWGTQKNFNVKKDNTKFLDGGDSGSASRFFKSFIYTAKANKSERGNRGVHTRTNNHPTVKPLALMKYLIQMITPPNGIVLDPFAGSGSTCVAAKELGFKFIGIEKQKEYVDICEARLKSVPERLL